MTSVSIGTPHSRSDSPVDLKLLAVLALAALIGWQLVARPITELLLSPGAAGWAPFLFVKGVFALAIVMFALATRSGGRIGLDRVGTAKAIFYGLPAWALAAAIAFSPEATWPLALGASVAWLAVAAAVAIGEEIVFRGYVQQSMGSDRLWLGALVSSAAFGSVHLLGLASDLPSEVIFAQSAFAFSLGLLFAAMRIVSGGLWWPIFLHFSFDAVSFLSAGGASELLSSGESLAQQILLISGIIILLALPILAFAIKRRVGEQV